MIEKFCRKNQYTKIISSLGDPDRAHVHVGVLAGTLVDRDAASAAAADDECELPVAEHRVAVRGLVQSLVITSYSIHYTKLYD